MTMFGRLVIKMRGKESVSQEKRFLTFFSASACGDVSKGLPENNPARYISLARCQAGFTAV